MMSLHAKAVSAMLLPQPGADEAPAVELRSAEKVFAGGVRGLAPVSLAVRPGEFVSLIGPSGCGKSTLLKLAAHLCEPSDGRVSWRRAGFDRVGEPGRRLAFVFQEPTLMPWASGAANVRLPLELAGVPRRDAQARAAAALAQVELAARAMARRLAMEPCTRSHSGRARRLLGMQRC